MSTGWACRSIGRLQALRRNSTIPSVVVSLLIIALIGVILALILLPSSYR